MSTFFNNSGAGHAETGRSDLLSNTENPVPSLRAVTVPGEEDLQIAVAQDWRQGEVTVPGAWNQESLHACVGCIRHRS